MSNILIELTAAVDAAGTLQTFYLSTGAFTTGASDTPTNTSFAPVVIDPGSIGIHAFSDGRVGGLTKLEIGEITIQNVDGEFDDWLGYGFDGQPAVIRYVGAGYEALRTVDYWEVKQAPFEYDWLAVCWSPELALFAAVAEAGTASGNRVMTSSDGLTWTARASASDNRWEAICWSPEKGLFVAVAQSGTGNRVMTSPDGINWTSRTSAADNSWQGVCWSPEKGLFVAVAQSGTGNRVMTSPDGINWTSRTSGADNNWCSVCWAAGLSLFVAVAQSGSGKRIMTSPDGITWTIRYNPINNDWIYVCWSPELARLVAVSSDPGSSNRVMTSDDGIVWTSRTTPVDNDWVSVVWSPELSLFCAVAEQGSGNRVMTSPDGINWTSRTSGADNNWSSLAWSPQLGLFVAVAQSGTGRITISPAVDNYPNGYPTLLHGTIESVEADFDKVVIRLRDRSYIFDRPVLTTTYAGSNVLPAGLEGTADDLKGRVKPKVYGKVLNVSPPCVNTSKLTYQINDGVLASIDAVYDQGAAITFGSNYATSALLLAATTSAGHYDTCIAEGYFQLGSSPAGQVTADATAGATAAVRTTAQILGQLAIAAGITSTDVWPQTQTELDRANSGVVGIYVDDSSTTFVEAMDAVAAGCGAYYGFDVFGYLRMGQLAEPSGTPIATLTTGDILDGFSITPTKDYSVPIHAFSLNHTRNWTPQTTDIAGAVTVARRGFLGLDYRTERAEDSAVLLKHILAGVDVSDSLFATVVGPVDNQWLAIAWSPDLGLFAAVSNTGAGNRVMTSPDGINWTAQASAANNNWTGVAWSPALGLFAAVANSGTGNRVMTSPDGIVWTSRTSAADSDWASICWSPALALFVAVASAGAGNRVMVSADGTTWTGHAAASAIGWSSVCWSAALGLLCAVASSGSTHKSMTSTDGTTWTGHATGSDSAWYSVCWAAALAKFVAVGPAMVMTSADGSTWVEAASP